MQHNTFVFLFFFKFVIELLIILTIELLGIEEQKLSSSDFSHEFKLQLIKIRFATHSFEYRFEVSDLANQQKQLSHFLCMSDFLHNAPHHNQVQM